MPNINNCCITALLAKLLEFMQANCNCGNGGSTGDSNPTGSIMHFAMLQAPAGWLECDGTEVAIQDYPSLFSAIGDTYGTSSNPNNLFKLPDLRGEFLRGFDHNRGIDEKREFASFQDGTVVVGSFGDKATPISVYDSQGTYPKTYGADKIENSTYANKLNSIIGTWILETGRITATEENKDMFGVTRPRNVALLACIKY